MTRKMVMAVVSHDQSERVLDKLISSGYGATFTESRGGMLRQRQNTLFIAADADRVDDVVDIIRGTYRTTIELSETNEQSATFGARASEAVTTQLGYAVIFVWDLDRFEVL